MKAAFGDHMTVKLESPPPVPVLFQQYGRLSNTPHTEINLILDYPYHCRHVGVCGELACALYQRAKRNHAASPPPQKVPASSIHTSIHPTIPYRAVN